MGHGGGGPAASAARAAAAHLRAAAVSPRRRCQAAPRGRSSITTLISAAHGNPTRPRHRAGPAARSLARPHSAPRPAPPRPLHRAGDGALPAAVRGLRGGGAVRALRPGGVPWGAVGMRHRPRGGDSTARLAPDARASLVASPAPRQPPGALRCFPLGRAVSSQPCVPSASAAPGSPAEASDCGLCRCAAAV
ncbi:bcl-2-binding component 3, isoforms 3/4-like [Ammospiza caudacuta]|uniref:bcl-2-binding component 3, isoforms 3/4-like n=1 Tax=Ammospiza caudacuta TaxID=2857398 RepID=UPI0027390AD5|nr:bcl-2-binding component 3, isoforms 3/4-like [Ammospiza caudacuta]